MPAAPKRKQPSRKRLTKRIVDKLEPKRNHAGRLAPAFVWDSQVTGFGCKATPGGRKVFIFQFRNRTIRNAKTERLTIGALGVDGLTVDTARDIAEAMRAKVRKGEDPGESLRKRDAPPTVSDLASRFLAKRIPGKKRPLRQSTIENYRRLSRLHIRPALGRLAVEAVSDDEIDRFHTRMGRTNPIQANRALSLLRQLFEYAERLGLRRKNSNPCQQVERYPEEPRGKRKEVMLRPHQIEALLSAIEEERAPYLDKQGRERQTDPFALDAILLGFWLGWRLKSEILPLRWENVDLEAGVARLLLTKTEDEEYRALPDKAVAVIREVPRIVGSPWIFPGSNPRKHLTTVRRAWVRVRKRAKLEDLPGLGPLRIHDLRHNAVSWHLHEGASLEVAGKLVGHKSRQATQVYAHFVPEYLREAANARSEAISVELTKLQKKADVVPLKEKPDSRKGTA